MKDARKIIRRDVISDTVRLNAYAILSRAVEEGAACGVRRAYKHNDQPSEEQVTEAVERGVMNAICEVLRFDD